MASRYGNLTKFQDWGRKIVAVGRNYKEHAAELGNAVPSKPLIFMKPSTAYLQEGQGPIVIPYGCNELHHEVELGVVIGRECKNVDPGQVMRKVAGYALALDMTARDFQEQAKAKGQPWELSKGFDTSLPVSKFLLVDKVRAPDNVTLWCKVNDVVRQSDSTSKMIFSISDLISYISHYVTLEPGDLVLTGTPAGVGPVRAGDKITCGMEDTETCQDIVTMEFNIAKKDEPQCKDLFI